MKKASNLQAAGMSNVENYITKLTGVKNHFSFVWKSNRKIAVFRRLSFLLPDETTMTRIRLLNEVKPQAQNSVLSGLYVGDVEIDKQGRLTNSLKKRREKLLKYLLAEPMGVFPVKKEAPGSYTIHHPGDFVETLLGQAEKITGKIPEIEIRDYQWHIKLPGMQMIVDRFRQACEIEAEEKLLLKILGISGDDIGAFRNLSMPFLLYAFGKTVKISGTMRHDIRIANQISDLVLNALFAEYEKLKSDFLAGKAHKISPRQKLPEIIGYPNPEIIQPTFWKAEQNIVSYSGSNVKIPAGANHDLYKEIAEQQYIYLRDCCVAEPVKAKFKGLKYSGIISTPDPTIYYPIWSVDHFLNTLAMADFDLETARKMLAGGFIFFMQLDGADAGAIPVKKVENMIGSTYPVWMPAIAAIYNKCRDPELLQSIFPFLELHNNYINKTLLRNGLFVGAGGYWNDYSSGPKIHDRVAGIGINSLIALEKKLMAIFATEIGLDAAGYQQEYDSLATRINETCWDDETGFYYDYDARNKEIFKTVAENRFLGLDNLLPLLGGFVPEERATSMEKYLLSSDYYGKYPAITTDFSPDYMDERRLMIWVMTNWLVVQGLNAYELHTPSRCIATNIFNALLQSWTEYRCLPEALSSTHGMYQMENANLAGVGSWAGFYLYLKEIYYKQDANRELHRQIRTKFS